jgi:NAD-dependent dihydropyrimidine dehydrogenase PreA subunit
MTTRITRKIVNIDEEKCNGCGQCAAACAEGAIKIIDGKARLISEQYCDGLGACLGECPQGAIKIEKREAADFDESATKRHLAAEKETPCACPSARVMKFESSEKEAVPEAEDQPSMLRNWPVQLALVPPSAPFLKGADLLLAADCVAYAYPDFHRKLLNGHALLVACPKLDDFDSRAAKLADILRNSDVKSVTVARMEVPCCTGLTFMAKQAIKSSGKNIPLKEKVIGIRGEIKT